MINKKALLAIESHLIAFFDQHGFVKTRGNILENSASDFERKTARSTEMVRCILQTDRTSSTILFVEFAAMKKYEIIEQFLDADDHHAMKAYDGIEYTARVHAHYPTDTFKFLEEEVNGSYERIATNLTDFIETHIFPALKYYDNVHALDAEANESLDSIAPIFNNNYWYHKMIIAKLAGNPVYDELSRSVVARFERAVEKKPDNQDYKNYLAIARKLSDKLQKTSSLTDPMIG